MKEWSVGVVEWCVGVNDLKFGSFMASCCRQSVRDGVSEVGGMRVMRVNS